MGGLAPIIETQAWYQRAQRICWLNDSGCWLDAFCIAVHGTCVLRRVSYASRATLGHARATLGHTLLGPRRATLLWVWATPGRAFFRVGIQDPTGRGPSVALAWP